MSTWKRKELIEVLGLVRPALVSGETIPILSHYWFNGKTVMASNNRVAISTSCETDFIGAVPGKVFMDLLESNQAESVSIKSDADKKNVIVKANKSNWNLMTLPAEDFLFPMAEVGKNQLVTKKRGRLLEALKCCELSLSDDMSRPDQTGVTMLLDGKWAILSSTNNFTLSRADVSIDKDFTLPEKGIILPGEFCKLITGYLTGDSKYTFEVTDEYALFTCEDVSIMGLLIDSAARVDHGRILDTQFPAASEKAMIEIPPGLAMVLEQSCIMINTKLDGQLRMAVTIDNGTAKFESRSRYGEVNDSLEMKDHPDVKMQMDPRLLRDALPFYEGTKDQRGKLLFAGNCAAVMRGGMTFLASSFFGGTT